MISFCLVFFLGLNITEIFEYDHQQNVCINKRYQPQFYPLFLDSWK